jgi:hypothetical protein
MKPNLIVTGHGRSGSNWLLRLFDKSPSSFCRSEINEIVGSFLFGIPSSQIRGEVHERDLTNLGFTLDSSKYYYSERDPFASQPKDYTVELIRRTTGQKFFRRRARLLQKVRSMYRENGEFKIPWWICSKRGIDNAVHIYKLLLVPEWIDWILENKPDIFVIHLIRHPLGYINSWHNRFFTGRNPEEIRAANIERLLRIRKSDYKWTIPWELDKESEFSNKELELWYWRYANEVTLKSGNGKPNYDIVTYRDLALNTDVYMRKFYQRVSLEYTNDIAQGIAEASKKSASIALKWETSSTPEDIELAKRILDGSPLATYFESKPQQSL